MITATHVTGFRIVGTAKSVSIQCIIRVCVCVLVSSLAPGWRLMSRCMSQSQPHTHHVCRPTWLQRSHQGGKRCQYWIITENNLFKNLWIEVNPEGLLDEKKRLRVWVLPPLHQTQTQLQYSAKAYGLNAADFPCTEFYTPPLLFQANQTWSHFLPAAIEQK